MPPLPLYKVRKAQLSDLEFIHQSVTAINQSNIGLNEFETLLKNKLKAVGYFIFILDAHHTTTDRAGLLIANESQYLIDKWPMIEIQEFFITPKFRKLGAADFMYSYLENFAKDKNAYKMKVSCKINSTLNQNFYTSRGFKISKKQYLKPVY